MKKLFTLLFAIVASVGMMKAAVYNGTCGADGDNLTWELNTEKGVLSITGTGAMADYTYNVYDAPWQPYKSYITSVIINDGITTIGTYAFQQCTSIKNVSIPKGVIVLGHGAFKNCSNLVHVTIPESVARLTNGGTTFQHCNSLQSVVWNAISCVLEQHNSGTYYPPFLSLASITTFTFGEKVEVIPRSLCEGLTGLTSVELPSNVKEVGPRAFRKCTGLTKISCYAVSVPNLGDSVFAGVDKSIPLYVPGRSVDLYKAADQWKDFTNIQAIPGTEPCILASGICGENLTWELSCDSVLTISGTGEMTSNPWSTNYKTQIKELVIKDGVTSIAHAAFFYCSNLQSATIPNSVTTIYNYAFSECNNLTSLTLPYSVTSIGQEAFSRCKSLTTIEIPSSVTCIGNWAFAHCVGLTSVTIPNSVTSIGGGIFSGCSGITEIQVAADNNNYCSVDGVLFNKDRTTLVQYPCGKQGNYAIPNTVTTIGDAAFFAFKGQISVTIPNSVTSLGDWAFDGCTGLSSITCEAVTPPACGADEFYGVEKSIPLYVPTESIDLYKAADQWKDFMNILPIPGTEVVEYPVIFLDYNSDVLSEQSVEEGNAAVAPEVPEREGYIFKGWNVDIEHIVARTFAIALYDKVGVEVTYKAEDGETIFSEHADLHFPDAPSITGKTFAGWLTENIDKNSIVLRATYTIDNPTTNDDVTVEPGSTSAAVTFPFVTGAITYVLVIRDFFGHVVCKIMFNAYGRLLGIAFAPSRERSQTSAQTDNFQFTVEGLDPSTTYEYEFIAHDETDDVIETLTGSFTTMAEMPTDVESPETDSASAIKVVQNDQVLILRGEKVFTITGQEVK